MEKASQIWLAASTIFRNISRRIQRAYSVPWSFHWKVLLPVMGTMVVLVVITMWIINRRISAQIEAGAGRELATADAVFKAAQTIRARNLVRRYQNAPKEPSFKAVSRTADASAAFRFLFREPRIRSELLDEFGAEVIVYTSADLKPVARASRDAQLSIFEFDSRSAAAVEQALAGDPGVTTVRVGSKLFDVVSVPARAGEHIVGALTFGTEINEAVMQEFKQVTHAEVVLVMGEQIAASTLQGQDLEYELFPAIKSLNSRPAPPSPLHGERVDRFGKAAEPAGGKSEAVRLTPGAREKPHGLGSAQVQIGGEHFVYRGGPFTGLSGDQSLGYLLLLSSYEQPLRVLHETQRMLALLSFAGILLSSFIVHIVVQKVTKPLRELRDGAEAVGQGDFSRHVPVRSRDECGELARVFNQMTDNLKVSREELEKTQAQLVQSEKLAGIGEFVAGVTHELNNPLTTVVGFAELLQQTQIDTGHRRFLEHINNAAQRCHKIVQSLLSFARQHKPERKLVNLHELVEGAISILAYQMRTSNIQAQTKFDPNLPKVMADPHQLQQVFLNLINNARQAIEAARPRGVITVTTERCERGVRLLFQDDGPGISEQNLKKVFDPFFTTKAVGKGTGLGLSLSYGIIQEHGGTINVRSKEGEGATFIIDLPIGDAAPDAAITQAAAKAVTLDGRGRRILLVDDEELILDLLQEALRSDGCQLDLARDGEIALRQLRAAHYDAIVCDWRMPGLNGQQVYERLHAIDPQAAARIIFVTGDIVNETTRQFIEQRGNRCLCKPFSLDEVRAVVSEVLKAARPMKS